MAEIDHDAAIAAVRGFAGYCSLSNDTASKELEAQVRYVADLAERAKCGTCGGTPPASGKICICNGTGLAVSEAQGLREALYAETERAKRLEEERGREDRFLKAVMETAQWNGEAPGDQKHKAAWRALALSIATHLATPPAQPFAPPDGQT